MKRHARIIALKVELYDSLSEICTVNFFNFYQELQVTDGDSTAVDKHKNTC